MGDPHWWLIALAFLLGLALTFALMIRRVTREVPVTTPKSCTGRRSGDNSEHPTAKISPADETPTVRIRVTNEERTTRFPAAGQARTVKMPVVKDAPYGAGSARARADGNGPPGWLVKGNEASRLYHTPDSPVYDRTVAEIWFKDEKSALRAGFRPGYRPKER